MLWSRSQETVNTISRDRQNKRYLPDIPLQPSLRCTADFDEAVDNVSDYLIAVPSSSFKSIDNHIPDRIDVHGQS